MATGPTWKKLPAYPCGRVHFASVIRIPHLCRAKERFLDFGFFDSSENTYREALITWSAVRSHVISARRASYDSSQWRPHVIAASCVSCDLSKLRPHVISARGESTKIRCPHHPNNIYALNGLRMWCQRSALHVISAECVHMWLQHGALHVIEANCAEIFVKKDDKIIWFKWLKPHMIKASLYFGNSQVDFGVRDGLQATDAFCGIELDGFSSNGATWVNF